MCEHATVWAGVWAIVFVRGWSGPNLLRRIFAASVNIVFASLFFPVFSYTNPMFDFVSATDTGAPRSRGCVSGHYLLSNALHKTEVVYEELAKSRKLETP